VSTAMRPRSLRVNNEARLPSQNWVPPTRRFSSP